MFLADYHMHSTHSDDARDSMRDMALSAASKGIKELCFTDHADECCIEKYLTIKPNMFFSQQGMFEEFESLRDELKDRITLRFGAELAAINHTPQKAGEFDSDSRFDFIIGSVHNVRCRDDFFYLKYESEEQCREIISEYLAEYIEIAGIGCCDVLGHLGYPQKYMVRQGFKSDIFDNFQGLCELIRLTVQAGIGLEVNTSGLRSPLNRTIPDERVLRLYREYGGEIVTVGSDSHRVSDAGSGIREAYDLLRRCGFKYVATFEKRRPKFIAI